MGTRAFIEFPTYEWRTAFEEPLRQIFGESKGSIYVWVAYDGDTLPCNLHAAIKKMLRKGESQLMLTPQRVAAELVKDIYEDKGEDSIVFIYNSPPDEGFHLWCDFKSRKVIYVGRDEGEGEGIFDMAEWIDHDWAPVFTYDEEDYV